jgi:hypothetical protein
MTLRSLLTGTGVALAVGLLLTGAFWKVDYETVDGQAILGCSPL